MDWDIRQELSKLSARDAAERLLGCKLIRETKAGSVSGVIVETEAYDQSDEASHTYRGLTKRNYVMFGPAGVLYVYFTYGMHYCMNVVIGEEGMGAAVLIRAVEPLDGIDIMIEQRKTPDIKNLCNGPAKLCQSFLIDKELNGHDLKNPPLYLELKEPIPGNEVVWTERIGIRQNQQLLWRACCKYSEYLSRPL